MRRALILLVSLALVTACISSPDTSEERSLLDRVEETPSSDGGAFENISSGLSEHVRDCGKGLDFTFRALGRRTRADAERFSAFFD